MDTGIGKLFFWMRLIAEFVIFGSFYLILDLMKNILYLVHPKKKDINGETVLVTGAARGIGRELALQLSGLGCNVICVDLNAEGNLRTAQDIVKMGHKAQAYTCDVSDSAAVEELAKKVGYVDILVNNAGIIFINSILKTQQSAVSKILEVNVASHFAMIRNFLPEMLARNKGHIVGVASCGGLIGLNNASLYSSSKFAVVGLMNSLSEELRLQGRSNIKISCVCPYFVRTIQEIDTEVDARITPIEAVDAAREIVQGILQEQSLFTVPNYWMGLISIVRLLPENTYLKMRDILYTRVKDNVK
ncbi:short-chain dehydrogenase/reductase family 16C member 6-like isoform X2 [Periplaneta americana]|uniref:short-chain dehydrogenase/reductase family 16C member 6-like isoform X2 n=1 Tax=Periplaneta americana TaxID=6978 RepID=UPI0037E8CB12